MVCKGTTTVMGKVPAAVSYKLIDDANKTVAKSPAPCYVPGVVERLFNEMLSNGSVHRQLINRLGMTKCTSIYPPP